MIAGIFHKGSGLGDQLFRYITTRTLALDKGYEFGMVDWDNFKGKDFMNLGVSSAIEYISDKNIWNEKNVRENGIDITQYDPEINFVEDNTIIDGNFEDEKYWGHRLPEIREWLKVEPLEMSDDLCVINFRGGEFATDKDLFLTQDYWYEAIRQLTNHIPFHIMKSFRFEVHTDDPILAKQFFPDFPIIQDIALNWRSIRYAKHLILSNSAFGILPMLLNENLKEAICPRYWARRNTQTWARPACYYKHDNIIYI